MRDDEQSVTRREFIKGAALITGVAVGGRTLFGLSQADADRQEGDDFLKTTKSEIKPVSLENEALLDDRLKELGVDLGNVSTFEIKVDSAVGFAQTSFAVSGRTTENPPRMFILDQNKTLSELKFWRRTPDENGETVNWYIPGQDVEGEKGIPGAEGMQDILAYRINPENKLSDDLYYSPPREEIPVLVQKEDFAGGMIPVASEGLTSRTQNQLLEVKS
jgi:hypothetical protein